MRNRFIIYLVGAGCMFASVLSGCKASGNSHYTDGMNYYEKAEYSKAIECFQKAVESDAKNAGYLVSLGMAQLEAVDYEGAKQSFSDAIILEDDNREAYRGLGLVYMAEENYTEAIDSFSKAESLSAKYDKVCIDSMKYLAGCYYEMENYTEAVNVYSRILNNTEKEEQCYIYYLRGCCYVMLDNESNAALDYEEAIKLNGTDYELCCNMYYYFKEAGYDDRAESYLKRIIQAEDADEFLKGKIYYILGDYKQAESNLLAAYDNGNNDAALFLAMTYEKNEDYVRAVELYQKYLNDHPNDFKVYNQYGAYLMTRESYDNALVYIETGLELADDDNRQELLYNEAVCYEYMGDFTKAKELFEAYIQLYPNDMEARKELEFLSSR